MSDPNTRLLAERERTVAELQRLRKYLGTEVDRFSAGGEDSVDAASDLHQREKTLGFVQGLERKLAAIERASQALEDGSYGICEICGKAINPERLAVIPQATTCVRCQEKLDRSPRCWASTPQLYT
ncbi:MAG TPA: TraR/DksA C4-type zinc finger protein [Anaerolineae bacterium]|nr:TraR/DksA C4-type zinc finger protein [Anaerolineae bacterium]